MSRNVFSVYDFLPPTFFSLCRSSVDRGAVKSATAKFLFFFYLIIFICLFI